MVRRAARLCLLAAALLVPAVARGQETSSELRWSVEFRFGAASTDPADLNAFSLNRAAINGADYDTLFRYYSAVYGPNITITANSSGGLPIIDRAWTGGAQASRRITPKIAVTLGLDYLSVARSSSMGSAWQLTASSPNAVAFPTMSGLSTDITARLSTTSYSALAGLRWTLWSPGPLALEAVAGGGPSYARCEISQDGTQFSSAYRQSTSSTGHMEGDGWRASVEAGLRLNWSVTQRWEAFVDGVYRYERFSSISGSSESQSARRDGDAATTEYQATASNSGRWQMVPYQATIQGRTVNQPYPAVAGSGTPFALDLSGPRLRVGLAFRFGAAKPQAVQ